MIISHQHRFIFIKTKKTAGTSIECWLEKLCGPDDVVTRIIPHVEGHVPRGWRGVANPLPELVRHSDRTKRIVKRAVMGIRYWNHIPAWAVRSRVGEKVWRSYYKFCFERNPWDKTLSHFHMRRKRGFPDLSFDDYLVGGRYALNYPLYTDPDDPDTLMVDFVGRYETLSQDLASVAARLNLPFNGSLDVFAKSEYQVSRRPYQSVYTPPQRRRVEEIFHREIARMGYRFE